MSHWVNASAVIVGETGILVRGASGSGKSRLVLALIEAAHGRGRFARLVGDDRIELANVAGHLVLRPHSAIAGRIERRGHRIAGLPFEAAAVAGLVVDLVAAADRLPEQDTDVVVLHQVRLARLVIWQEVSVTEAVSAVFWDLQRRPQEYKV